MSKRIRTLLEQDSTWRLIDAYAPRVFALFLNTFLIAHFGPELYALPAWILGVLGLMLTIFPDPHSYILVRAVGRRAKRLYALSAPALIFKSALAAFVIFFWLIVTDADSIVSPHESEWYLVALSTLFYGAVEFLWSVLGTVSLSLKNVKYVAVFGILSRVVAILLLFTAWICELTNVYIIFVLSAAPIFISWCLLTPFCFRWERSWIFYKFSVANYAGWMQGISLVTSSLLQMPVIVLGVWPNQDPSVIGVVAFSSRLIMLGFQPFQILQSVIIRDAAERKNRGVPVSKTPVWALFRLGGLAGAVLTLASLIVCISIAKMPLEVLILVASMSLGVMISVWYRPELAVSLVVSNTRDILIKGYLPSLAFTIVLALILSFISGVYGFAAALLVGWISLSNCWRWVS